jgi:predicted metal-dependent enzyme (double-stranded beta helix superfamily)
VTNRDEPLSLEALTAIASTAAAHITGDELDPPPDGQRRYRRLLVTPAYEVWLIAWQPAGALDLHDHGGSRGAVHVARGTLIEAYVDGPSGRRVRTRRLRAGTSVGVPAHRIHEVWNPGPDTTLNVHAYSPPIGTMGFYERDAAGAIRRTQPAMAG